MLCVHTYRLVRDKADCQATVLFIGELIQGSDDGSQNLLRTVRVETEHHHYGLAGRSSGWPWESNQAKTKSRPFAIDDYGK